MNSTMTTRNRITLPKKVREALCLAPGDAVDFILSRDGKVMMRKAGMRQHGGHDRFDAARGKAQVKWRTDELIALMRGGI